MSSSQEFLTTQEFAQQTGVSTSTVSKWLRTEKIKGFKKSGKWMIPDDEISKVTTPPKDQARKTPKPVAETSKPKAGTKAYTVKEFSEMTYLTEFGVQKWLKEGRLIAAKGESGQPMVDSSNLELP
ncbi:MAG: helix-turn-helix domain-containing protein, partial [Desulfobacteraceae bacterium]